MERQFEVRYVNFRPVDAQWYRCCTQDCAIMADYEVIPDDKYYIQILHCKQHLFQYAQYVFERYRIVLQAIE